jgi:single-stranded-DNA-specific exonuclease
LSPKVSVLGRQCIIRKDGPVASPDALLAARGFGAEEAALELRGGIGDFLSDPYAIPGVEAAAARIARAIVADEQIALFTDFDCDGSTSGALLYRFLRSLGASVGWYVPDRLTEGYGPNVGALRRIKDAGAELLVVLDSGTTAASVFEDAKWTDVVVIDHHATDGQPPRVSAVVNPKVAAGAPGANNCASVGLAFVVLVAVDRLLAGAGCREAGDRERLRSYLDLVAMGTVADVVPLRGLNRPLVRLGLAEMSRRRNVGIAALAAIAKIEDPSFSAFHQGFVLGPRVNAGGRIGRCSLGLEILAEEDPARAAELASVLDGLNAERRAMEKAAVAGAIAKLGPAEEVRDSAIVVRNDAWHPGIVGLIAARLKEAYARPAFALTAYGGDVVKGSGRSVRGFDLGACVIEARKAGLLKGGGGHPMAAGVSLGADQVAAFKERMCAEVAQVFPDGCPREHHVDGYLGFDQACLDVARALEGMAPFGAGFPEPSFAMRNVLIEDARPLGEAHLRLRLSDGVGRSVEALSWGTRGDDAPALRLGEFLECHAGQRATLAVRLSVNRWRQRESVRLVIEDARLDEC